MAIGGCWAGASDEFRYDPAGRLIEVTMKDPGGAVTGIVQYGYDANGLMTGRRQLAADGTTVLSHTGYLHEGLQRVAELDLSQADPSITHLYLHGTQANEVVATSTFTDSGYDTVWSFTDALGSVATTATKSLSDWSVVHTVTAEYGGSPSRIGDTNVEALMSLQVWAGHHRDEATSLIEAKARWYDPDSGRFTVPDPKGFAAGDSNLYRYVGNGPGNATDPDGLEERKTGLLHALDLALGRAIQSLFRRANDSYYGRGGGHKFIQDQVQHLGETPQRFRENGTRIGRFPGQFRHRKLTAQKADLDLQIIDRQIEAGTFQGDRSEQRLEIFRYASTQIDQSYQVQTDSLKASGELAVETVLIGAPLAPKLNLRVGVTGLARGRVVTPNRGLVHMTDAADAINDTKRLGLPSDLYAGPASNASRSGWRLTGRTGLSPKGTFEPIHVPSAAESAFSRPLPIGPVTLWQRAMGQQYTARGVINLETGAFTRTGINRTQAQWYAIDVGLTGTAATAGGLYWWSTTVNDQ